MSRRWSPWETHVIEFFASFNRLVDEKYTASYVYDVWKTYYPNFPERSIDSISHKLREVTTYDIKEDFIDLLELSGRSVLNANDIAVHYSIPVVTVDILMNVLEDRVFKIKFYNRQTCSVSVKATLDLITNKTKVIHAQEFFEEQTKDTKTVQETKTEVVEDQNETKTIIDRINEIQFELDNAYTPKNRRKALKKTLKKYKKQLGMLTSEEEEVKPEPAPNKEEPPVTVEVREIEPPKLDIVHFKLGVISDTHIGTKWFDDKALNYFYKQCSEDGVCKVIHAGDLFDGSTSYAYQEKDQSIVGYHNQFNWIVKNYPRYDGISTFVVAGNHDVGIMKKHNIHPIIELAKVRYDIKYSGDYYTDFNKHGVKIRVIHCDGVNYTGEPMTKLKSLIDTTYQKCHIFIMGHLHQAMELHDYGDIPYAVAPGCFVKPNEYTIRRSYVPAIGGFILDVTYDPTRDKLNVNSKWVSMKDDQ